MLLSRIVPEGLAFNLMQLIPSVSESQFKANLDQALYAADVLGYATAQGWEAYESEM